MLRFKVLTAVVALLMLSACHDSPQTDSLLSEERAMSMSPTETPIAPLAEQRPHVVSAPAGDRTDPWYWLRDDERQDPDILAYLTAENEYKEARLAHLSEAREGLFSELRGRIIEDDSSVPYFDRGYWYYTRFEQGKEYPIYARRPGSMDADEEILLDVNVKAAEHAFYQVGDMDISLDGSRLAWLEDTVGRRQYRLRIRDLTSDELIDAPVDNAASLSWSGDTRHLFYVANHPETLRSWQVRRLDLEAEGGITDTLIYQEDDAAFYTGVGRTTSDAFNLIFLSSTVSTEVHVLPTDTPTGEFQVFYRRQRDHEYSIDHLGDRWLIQTNHEAPNFRIMSVTLNDHADRQAWTDVVAHDEQVFIHGFDAFEQFLAISERSDGLRRLRILDWQSGESSVLSFDEPAYAAYLSTNVDQRATRLRFVYTSMTTPAQTWEIDMRTGERELLKQNEVGGVFNREDYVTERRWIEARDGTRVPVSILHHRNTALDGSAPLYQFAYGSYGFSMDPTFSSNRLSLVDRGFVFAIAHVRGGQELGRQWYDQGRLLNKMNTFTDFIDVTDALVGEGLVDAGRVFAMGGSAGGLLMGAIANLAPDRYRGLVAHVPFVDVVTTMLDESIPLTTNEFDEWGNPMDPEFYEVMLSYSPYDNVVAQDYPAMLVTTGLWDSQVQYWEPAKWVAKLRVTKTDDQPLLLHTNMEAGHGGASGRFQRLRETAMEYAFVIDQAGLSHTLPQAVQK